MDESIDDILERYLEAPMRTEEAAAYGRAASLDDLYFEAGLPIAAHALEMASWLGLGSPSANSTLTARCLSPPPTSP